jgi:small nuclear ribonucleoprotein (snRNP)-like protein
LINQFNSFIPGSWFVNSAKMLHPEQNPVKLELNGSSVAPLSTNNNQRTVSKWMGKRLRVDLIDGRTITGILVCTDNEPNFILTHADEAWNQTDEALPKRSQIGSVLINARHVRRILKVDIFSSVI